MQRVWSMTFAQRTPTTASPPLWDDAGCLGIVTDRDRGLVRSALDGQPDPIHAGAGLDAPPLRTRRTTFLPCRRRRSLRGRWHRRRRGKAHVPEVTVDAHGWAQLGRKRLLTIGSCDLEPGRLRGRGLHPVRDRRGVRKLRRRVRWRALRNRQWVAPHEELMTARCAATDAA